MAVKSTHEFWEAWKSMRRIANRTTGLDPRWNDFWTFVADVSPKPSGARLYKLRPGDPYSRSNFEWRKPITTVDQRRDKNAYMRDWHRNRPAKSRNNELRRNFGISLADYEQRLAAQNGVCAVCKGPERTVDRRTDKPFPLAVDHCHDTSKVRGLLCSHCNRGLGSFEDNPERLRAAALYLEQGE